MISIGKNQVTRNSVNQRILASCDFYAQNDNESWIQELKETCLTPQKNKETVVTLQSNNEQKIQQALISNVDRIMDALRHYTLIFNQGVSNELYLTLTQPVLESDHSSTDQLSGKTKTTTYRGRVSSRKWSLVVASKAQQIEFTLLPSSHLLHCDTPISQPLFTVYLRNLDGEIEWFCADAYDLDAYGRIEDFNNVTKKSFKQLVESIFADIENTDLDRRQVLDRRQDHDRRQNNADLDYVSFLEERRIQDRRAEERRIPLSMSYRYSEQDSRSSFNFNSQEISFQPASFERLAALSANKSANNLQVPDIGTVADFGTVSAPAITPVATAIVPEHAIITNAIIPDKTPVPNAVKILDETSIPEAVSIPKLTLIPLVVPNDGQIPQNDQIESSENAIASEHEIAIFLLRLQEAAASPSLAGIIEQTLDERLKEEGDAMIQAAKWGVRAFREGLLEQVSISAKEALFRRRILALFISLKKYWSEIAELEDFIEYNATFEAETLDQTFYSCSPNRRLHVAAQLLLKSLSKIGAYAFVAKDFELVRQACFHSARLESFAKRTQELCNAEE